MKANKKRDTKPELLVRKLLHSLGYRYRLHARDLPGNPDIVFRTWRKVIFVHGCFWHQHQHSNCHLRTHPKSNLSYWRPKLRRNQQRDIENQRKIAALGWRTVVIWECELSDPLALETRVKKFLSNV